MHMADALLSPVVGGVFWIVSGALIGYSAKKIGEEKDNYKTPLMGVMGAFVFAAQMINFSIPGTGSSGHIGGGLLLAVLLGPYRAFITIGSILTIQSLFFADGGILALGCNMFNLGFFPAFVAYPFIYKPICGTKQLPQNVALASFCAASASLFMGAFSVILQTVLSGISELPFETFALFMLPIHLAIGVVEGLLVWGVLFFVIKNEPALLSAEHTKKALSPVIVSLAIAALFIGGIVVWFASSNPDGLEWSISKVTNTEKFEHANHRLHSFVADIQDKVAFLPDYSFKASTVTQESAEQGSPVNLQTSIAGLAGSILVLLITGTIGFLIRGKGKKSTIQV